MKVNSRKTGLVAITVALLAQPFAALAHTDENTDLRRFVSIEAADKVTRSKLANHMSIEFVRSDRVWGFVHQDDLAFLKTQGFNVLSNHEASVGRGGHQGPMDFPSRDSRFHNYQEAVDMIQSLSTAHPNYARRFAIGKSVEGRDIVGIRINSDVRTIQDGVSTKPGIVFFGAHHAREHLSTEVPLLLAKYLLENRASNPTIQTLLDTRDIFIVPIVNPDGKEFDIATSRYRSWRKNRRDNNDGNFGVDLNRNYGFQWGTGGSSSSTRSDVFKGPTPFSEPETQAVKRFVERHTNTKILLSFHTFSELILYPWGHKNDPIENGRDLAIHQKMATTMARWNNYTPQQSSDLYIASGDTTDWSYGALGIISFTFELSPKSIWNGGFYPGQGKIDSTFRANLRPALYLIDLANDPTRVLTQNSSRFLSNLYIPEAPVAAKWGTLPSLAK